MQTNRHSFLGSKVLLSFNFFMKMKLMYKKKSHESMTFLQKLDSYKDKKESIFRPCGLKTMTLLTGAQTSLWLEAGTKQN